MKTRSFFSLALAVCLAVCLAASSLAVSAQPRQPQLTGLMDLGEIQAVENCDIVNKEYTCDVYDENGNSKRINISRAPKKTIERGDQVAFMKWHNGTSIDIMILVNNETALYNVTCSEDTQEKRAAKLCSSTYPEEE